LQNTIKWAEYKYIQPIYIANITGTLL